ncbi:MAG: glycerol-3-phosphate 1-O-acyltransferase PlsY [Novosphingobium sp.]|nr:glycerol-3-phosphate 1-O-acyltransferase PlsY [Novosphingobium sp.]
MDAVYAFALAYLLGSIPFGLLLTRLAGTRDLREVGSGSIGATNVLRTGSKWLAAATLLLDLLKGLAAVLIAWRWFPDGVAWAALGAVIGHCFPIWAGFRGGKGVATKMGVALGLGWQLGLAYAVVWIAVLAITRVSSLAGMSAAVSAPIAAAMLGEMRFVPVLVALAALVLWQHRGNIARLARGEEPRVGAKT